MVNGDSVIIFEEANCSRLQEEFLRKQCRTLEECEAMSDRRAEDLLNSEEYQQFVLEEFSSE